MITNYELQQESEPWNSSSRYRSPTDFTIKRDPDACFTLGVWDPNPVKLFNGRQGFVVVRRPTPSSCPSPELRVLTLSRKHSFSRVLPSRISTSKKRTAFLDFLVVLGPSPLTFLWRGWTPSAGTKIPSMLLRTAIKPPEMCSVRALTELLHWDHSWSVGEAASRPAHQKNSSFRESRLQAQPATQDSMQQCTEEVFF